MGRLIREKDWMTTSLGPPERWPPALCLSIRLMLMTEHPIFIFWGPDHICFYNDAYSRSLGPEKDPSALGAPAREIWEEIWDIIGPQIDHVMAGKGATWHENALVPITRNGRREDVYWTYSYSPINDPSSLTGVGGILVICSETTPQVELTRRRQEEAEEANVSLRETQHRVKNNIATIIAMVNMEERRLKSEELRQPLRRISSRLHSFAKLYEMMLSTAETEYVDAGAYLGELCNAMHDLSTGAAAGDVQQAGDFAACKMRIDKAIALGAIAIELVSNAISHAFPDRDTGLITVMFEEKGGGLLLTVADNGVGSRGGDQGTPSSTGIGMQLVEHYAETLNATLDRHADDQGTKVRLSIPAH